MASWQAWLIIGGLFSVPGLLLWRWRHEPSKPQARQDLEDAYEFAQRTGRRSSQQLELDRWRAAGRIW